MPSDRLTVFKDRCPTPLTRTVERRIADGLKSRHEDSLLDDDRIVVRGATGKGAALISVAVGPKNAPWDFEFFVENVPGKSFDGALGIVVDFADGILDAFFESDREALLPLEFLPMEFEGHDVICRSEKRRIDLENAADALLSGFAEGDAKSDDDGDH